jgi:hypothetical protein
VVEYLIDELDRGLRIDVSSWIAKCTGLSPEPGLSRQRDDDVDLERISGGRRVGGHQNASGKQQENEDPTSGRSDG